MLLIALEIDQYFLSVWFVKDFSPKAPGKSFHLDVRRKHLSYLELQEQVGFAIS